MVRNRLKNSSKTVTMVTSYQVKTKLIHDVIPNDLNHHNDTFLQNNGRKTSFKNLTMVTKMLHVYISVTVPDWSIVTIIDT